MKRSIKRRLGNRAREEYWNEDYLRYWKARVEEANESAVGSSSVVKGDTKTSADSLYMDAIGLLRIGRTEKVLELGCGFGRSLSRLCSIARHVTAVDISEEMIKMAKESCQEKNISFHVSPSEDLPFPDGSFDAIVCFAAFDAMYQAEALIEMNRVSKTGARVLTTGKNDNYYDDDTVALEAEVGARVKKHPNYFTDIEELVKNLDKFGFDIDTQKYYLRRGDFSKKIAEGERPAIFYEYLLVFTKTKPSTGCEGLEISSKVSKTYARRKRLA